MRQRRLRGVVCLIETSVISSQLPPQALRGQGPGWTGLWGSWPGTPSGPSTPLTNLSQQVQQAGRPPPQQDSSVCWQGRRPGAPGPTKQWVPCVPARCRGAPPQGGARHHQSGLSGHPCRERGQVRDRAEEDRKREAASLWGQGGSPQGWAGSHRQLTLGDRVPRILITTFFLSWSTAT